MSDRFATLVFLVSLLVGTDRAHADDGLSTGDIRDWGFYNNTGWLYLNRGDYKNAELRFHAAIKAVKNESADDPRLLARSYHDLALVLYYQKRYAEAEPMAKWSLEVRDKNKRVKPDALFQSVYMLALIHYAERHYIEAEALFKRAMTLQETSLGVDQPAEAPTYDNLASVYRERGKYTESEPLFLRAIAIREKSKPDENLDLADTLDHYALLLRKTLRNDEAEVVEFRSKKIRENVAEKKEQEKNEKATKGFQTPRMIPR